MLLVKDLEKSFYIEDIAAAAIALLSLQGGPEQQVRRRTLNATPSPFIPLKTKEAAVRNPKRKPAAQPAHSAGKQQQQQHAKPMASHGKTAPGKSRGQRRPAQQGGQSQKQQKR